MLPAIIGNQTGDRVAFSPCRRPCKQRWISNLNLIHCQSIVEGIDGHLFVTTVILWWCIEQSIKTHVSTIDDLLTKLVRVVSPVEGVPSQVSLSATSRSDCLRSKSSAKEWKLRKCVANIQTQVSWNVYPGLWDTPVSKGKPRIAMSKSVLSSCKQRIYGRCEKDRGPENVRSICGPYFSTQVGPKTGLEWLGWLLSKCTWLGLLWAKEVVEREIVSTTSRKRKPLVFKRIGSKDTKVSRRPLNMHSLSCNIYIMSENSARFKIKMPLLPLFYPGPAVPFALSLQPFVSWA